MMAVQQIPLLEYVAYLLAVFGLSITISNLDGPLGLCKLLRQKVRRQFADKSDHWVVSGIGCPVCVSFWISAVFAISVYANRGLSPVQLFTMWLSAVGFTGAIVWLSPPSE